ncbi:hypothetical protein [Natrialba magadii]|uniref:hypothetical protein n=1 Tax=Natrialba magadii TaxID=13769 RepID=UPI0011D1720B|nr:hypothetical protein [Natrialba magadii]
MPRYPDHSRTDACGWLTDPGLLPAARRIQARATDPSVKFDSTRQSPFNLEIWCGKGLLDNVHVLADDLGVNVIVEGDGDLSITLILVEQHTTV